MRAKLLAYADAREAGGGAEGGRICKTKKGSRVKSKKVVEDIERGRRREEMIKRGRRRPKKVVK